MEGRYGFDVKTRTYWFKIDFMGEQVDSGRGLSKQELDDALKSKGFANWRSETSKFY